MAGMRTAQGQIPLMNPPATIGLAPPACTIVTVLRVELSPSHPKLYNPDYRNEKGLPVPAWLAT